jgi:hypothetical protein
VGWLKSSDMEFEGHLPGGIKELAMKFNTFIVQMISLFLSLTHTLGYTDVFLTVY